MSTIKSVSVNIAAGAVMTIVTTIAQVGLEFYKISQLPTAIQFGSQCLSTFAKGGLVFGACALIALGTDAIFNAVQEKYFYQDVVKENVETKTEVALCYLLKRAITVICVGSFALLTGSSILVPVTVIVVLLAKDALSKLSCKCSKTSEVSEINPSEDIFDAPIFQANKPNDLINFNSNKDWTDGFKTKVSCFTRLKRFFSCSKSSNYSEI